MKTKRFCYRQGVVLIANHEILIQGQVVEIINESESFYKVRVNSSSPVFELHKENILLY